MTKIKPASNTVVILMFGGVALGLAGIYQLFGGGITTIFGGLFLLACSVAVNKVENPKA